MKVGSWELVERFEPEDMVRGDSSSLVFSKPIYIAEPYLLKY